MVQKIKNGQIQLTNKEAIHLSECLAIAAEESRDHDMLFPVGLISIYDDKEEKETIQFLVSNK